MKLTEDRLRRFVCGKMANSHWFEIAEQLGTNSQAAKRVDEIIAGIHDDIERARLIEIQYVLYDALRDFWHVFGLEEKLPWKPTGWNAATAKRAHQQDESTTDC